MELGYQFQDPESIKSYIRSLVGEETDVIVVSSYFSPTFEAVQEAYIQVCKRFENDKIQFFLQYDIKNEGELIKFGIHLIKKIKDEL